MQDRELIVTEVGRMLEHAVRTSMTYGAIYDPGEHIDRDPKRVWREVAETLVGLVEVMIKHGDVLNQDRPQAKSAGGMEVQRGPTS